MDWDGDFKQSFPKNKDLATSDPIETNGSAIKNDDNQNTLVEIYLPLFFYTQKKRQKWSMMQTLKARGFAAKPRNLSRLKPPPGGIFAWGMHWKKFQKNVLPHGGLMVIYYGSKKIIARNCSTLPPWSNP